MESCCSVIYMITSTWIMVAPGPDDEEQVFTARIRIVLPFNETIAIADDFVHTGSSVAINLWWGKKGIPCKCYRLILNGTMFLLEI